MTTFEAVLRKYKFPFQPWQYQVDKLTWHEAQSTDRFALYWDMGSGKTLGATILSACRYEEQGSQVVLVVPPILIRQWVRWIERCGLTAKAYMGTPAKRKAIEFDRNTRYFVMSIDILKRDFDRIENELAGRKILYIVDEATSIKNHESGNFRAILQLTYGQQLGLLTGTPLSTPLDAYAYIKLISPDRYRSYKQFENIHVAERDFFDRPVEWAELPLLQRNLFNRASRVETREVNPDLPAENISDIEYDLDPHHARLYRTLVDQQLLQYETGTVIDATTPNKLYHAVQQIVVNYAYFAQDNSLVPQAFELLDEVIMSLRGQKLVVFANYKLSVKAIMGYLSTRNPPVKAVQINGEVGQKERDAAIDSFVNDPATQVMVMNPQAGGVGVDGLQHVCHHMLFLELPTTPRLFWQAVARLVRPGQKFVTDVRVATALGTVQVPLRKELVRKDALINTIVPSVNDLRKALLGL